MSQKIQELQNQLSNLASQLGVLAFNREQAELLYQQQSAPVVADMRAVNQALVALQEAEAAARAEVAAKVAEMAQQAKQNGNIVENMGP